MLLTVEQGEETHNQSLLRLAAYIQRIERGGGIRRLAGYPDRGPRPRRSLNQILTGNQLTKLLTVPLVGYVAQLVSAGTKYASLEGNVLANVWVLWFHPTFVDLGKMRKAR